MQTNNEISTAELWNEGREMAISLVRTSPTSLTLTWNLPPKIEVFAGSIIVISASLLEAEQQPIDGERYSASPDLATPADTIGGAQVVYAAYTAFGDVVNQTTLLVTGLDPNLVYYAAIHACTGVLQYYPFGSKTYALDGARAEHNVDGYAGSIPESAAPPLNPTVGQVYYQRAANKVLMWNGAVWMPASTDTPLTGKTFPTTTVVAGQFFYQQQTQILYVWNGIEWVQANTAQVGTPSYDKVGVGTTGSLDERVRLINVIKAQLGWPAVCVELKEENFEAAIDIALSEFRRRSDSAYHRRHVLFTIKAGQPSYFLNDPVIGTDKIVDIYKAHRVSTIGLNVMGGDNGIYAQIFYNQFFYGAMIDILSIHMANAMAEEYEKIFAGALPFEWHEASRELTFLRKLYKDERVVLECFMEKTEQELLTDRWSKNWIRDWTLAKCWEMLGMIRSKYANLPGAGGGLALNGSELLQKSETMYTELQRQINDFEVGNLVDVGNVSFLMG